MTDEHEDLLATAEDLVEEAARLKDIEQRKLEVRANAPALAELAAEAEELGRRIAAKTRAEKQLSDRLAS